MGGKHAAINAYPGHPLHLYIVLLLTYSDPLYYDDATIERQELKLKALKRLLSNVQPRWKACLRYEGGCDAEVAELKKAVCSALLISKTIQPEHTNDLATIRMASSLPFGARTFKKAENPEDWLSAEMRDIRDDFPSHSTLENVYLSTSNYKREDVPDPGVPSTSVSPSSHHSGTGKFVWIHWQYNRCYRELTFIVGPPTTPVPTGIGMN